jgi:CO/xanthine dehydrogenase FAD-binding subunit
MFIKRLPAFEYHAPASIAKALDLMARYKNKGRFVAGGTDLLVAMKKREVIPQHLISLNGIAALKGITPDKKGGVTIGALTTLAEIERSDIIHRQFLPLRDAINVMASAQVRSLATIGGNLCSAVPSADTAPPLIALNASLQLVGPKGKRSISVEAFFTGPAETVRKSNEILKAIMIPKPEAFSSGCYLKLMRRQAMDLALVGVAACLSLDKEKKICTEARIALGAVAPTPIRVHEVEALLVNKAIDEKLITEAARVAGMQCRPISDIRASLEYRCSMVEVLTRRAVTEAYRRIIA